MCANNHHHLFMRGKRRSQGLQNLTWDHWMQPGAGRCEWTSIWGLISRQTLQLQTYVQISAYGSVPSSSSTSLGWQFLGRIASKEHVNARSRSTSHKGFVASLTVKLLWNHGVRGQAQRQAIRELANTAERMSMAEEEWHHPSCKGKCWTVGCVPGLINLWLAFLS